MTTWTGSFIADDGTSLEVDCVLASEGRDCGWYVDSVTAWRTADGDDPHAPLVELTEVERERLDQIIGEKSAEIDSDLAQDWSDW